jgi:hypothetical protein
MEIETVAAVPALELLYSSRFELSKPIDVGPTPLGLRRKVPITGGAFEGPKLKGTVLPGGEDWQLIRSDGVVEVDARYVLQTEAGARIHVRNRGIMTAPREVMIALAKGERPPSTAYYFRTQPVFESGHADLTWLHRITAVAAGEVRAGYVLISVYAVT